MIGRFFLFFVSYWILCGSDEHAGCWLHACKSHQVGLWVILATPVLQPWIHLYYSLELDAWLQLVSPFTSQPFKSLAQLQGKIYDCLLLNIFIHILKRYGIVRQYSRGLNVYCFTTHMHHIHIYFFPYFIWPFVHLKRLLCDWNHRKNVLL